MSCRLSKVLPSRPSQQREQGEHVSADEEAAMRDLAALLNEAALAHAFASGGLRKMFESMANVPIVPENPDPWVYVGRGDPNLGAKFHAGTFLSRLSNLLQKDGEVDRLLGHQWVTYVFAAWEHEFRPRLAGARGVELSAVLMDEFGDLRLLRNDILHHGGVATRSNAARCVTLRWFEEGDEIRITDEHIAQFMDQLGLTGDVPPSDLRNG